MHASAFFVTALLALTGGAAAKRLPECSYTITLFTTTDCTGQYSYAATGSTLRPRGSSDGQCVQPIGANAQSAIFMANNLDCDQTNWGVTIYDQADCAFGGFASASASKGNLGKCIQGPINGYIPDSSFGN